jgi:hypothetical protein
MQEAKVFSEYATETSSSSASNISIRYEATQDHPETNFISEV